MKEQYLCASCRKTFKTKDAVDGFAQGYRTGFLCPFCNANLHEAGESDDIFHLQYGLIYSISMICISAIARDSGLLTFSILTAIPTIAFLLVNRKAIFGTKTIYTRKIPKK